MKTLLFTLLALISLKTLAHKGHQHDRPSVHGMLMTGKSQIFLSHLPMFHSPHDYQVIFKVQIDAASELIYQENLKSSPEKVYTLVPESFVLSEMAQNPKSFKAQIFKGHFERGSELIADNVTAEVVIPVYYKKFDPAAVQPSLAKYILFGNTEEMFLAHVITAKPDYDQIVKVKPTKELLSAMGGTGSVTLASTAQENTAALQEGQTVQLKSPRVGELNAQIESVIYLETGDLSF